MPLLPLTSDLQPRGSMADLRSFDLAGLQNLNPLSSTQPESMEASSMESVQNQSDHQNQQPCKYDLLSSVPRESGPVLVPLLSRSASTKQVQTNQTSWFPRGLLVQNQKVLQWLGTEPVLKSY